MNRLYAIAIMIAGMLGFSGCSSGNAQLWNELPEAVSQFCSRYFPGEGVSRYVEEPGGGCMVEVEDGPSIIFNSSYRWKAVDGNGEVLPQIFLFDELPPALYSFLQDNGNLDGVYKASRDDTDYELTLLSTVVAYDIATGQVSFPYGR